MDQFNSKNYSIYTNFLNKLALELTKFYYSKLNKTFEVSNKLKGKGYDPVTTSDKAFEKFIRSKIKKKFPNFFLAVYIRGNHHFQLKNFTVIVSIVNEIKIN